MTYHREVREGDPLRFTTLLIAHDAKRLHYLHQMYHATEGYLAAANELMTLHVSEETRRGAPMAPEVLERLRAIQNAHDRLERPPQVGLDAAQQQGNATVTQVAVQKPKQV